MPAARHIPYTAQISGHVVLTEAGDYLQTFRLAGASFESADDDELPMRRCGCIWYVGES